MRSPLLALFAVSLLPHVAGCAAAPDDDEGESTEALSAAARTGFVLAAADAPACVRAAATDAPIEVGDCAGAPTLVYDAKKRTIHPKGDPNRCLDVRYAHKSAGAEVIFHACHGQSNQSWRLTNAITGDAPLASALRVEAYASDGASSLCLASRGGKLLLDDCDKPTGWVLDRLVGERLVQRGNVVTSLLTMGMIEPANAAGASSAQRDKLAPEVAQLAADLVDKVMPRSARSQSPRVLVVLDDAHHDENAGDAALTADALRDLLKRTKLRLEVKIRAGVEITVDVVQAVVIDELSALSVTAVRERTTVHLLVSIALIATMQRADVELVTEPSGGLTVDTIRMNDGRRPHVVWFSNPGHVIDSPSSIEALRRFAQRGGGVVVQGDDAAQGTAALTGLELRASWAEANGHTYCGKSSDNGAGAFPLSSRELDLDGMIYTDDLDLARVTDTRARVLATAKPACNGGTETVPAIVIIGADR